MKKLSVETKKLLLRSAFCGFLLTAAAGSFPFAASCARLPDQVVRLHVMANSDSPEDQAVKLKVRDAVLAEAGRWCGDASSMEEASAALCVHLESIREAADRVLEDEGVSGPAAVQVTDRWFPTRDYEGFSLPAGKYRTLQVTLGEGKGQNWWCVVFPALCLPAAQGREDPLAFLGAGERELVEHPEKYRIKFKAVELYQELRSRLDR